MTTQTSKTNTNIYTLLASREEWDALIAGAARQWYADDLCSVPAETDIYTEGGWNVPPPRYPALVMMAGSEGEGR